MKDVRPLFAEARGLGLVALSVALAVAAVAPSLAADSQSGAGAAASSVSVAFVPFRLQTNNGVGSKLDPALLGVFEALGFGVVIGLPVRNAIRACCGEATAAAGATGFPSLPEEAMAQIGRLLGVRYVICGDMTLMSDRTWYGRASATASLKTAVVDVQTEKITYASSVKTDSKEDVIGQVAVAVLVAPILAPFVGGSKTKHEGKALQNVLVKAYDPFFARLRGTPGQTPPQ